MADDSLPDIPATGPLPGCFSPLIADETVRALPRPREDAPAEHGRQMLHEAMAMVAEYAPCTVVEARIVMQIIIWQFRAARAVGTAARQAMPAAMERGERHAMTQIRATGALERRLACGQRARMKAGIEVPEMGTWDYDLAALEAVWRGVEMVTEEVAAAKPPAPRVPLWKQNGRQYIHQIKDNELAELMEAKEKGEELEWPPYHPRDPVVLGWRPDPEPKKPYKYWGDMTMEERRERYGYKTTEQMAAEKAAQDAAAGDAGVGG
jgi:hypothetical protein